MQLTEPTNVLTNPGRRGVSKMAQRVAWPRMSLELGPHRGYVSERADR